MLLNEVSLTASIPLEGDSKMLTVKPTYHAYLRLKERQITFSEVVDLTARAKHRLTRLLKSKGEKKVLGVMVSGAVPHLYVPFELRTTEGEPERLKMEILTAYRASYEKDPRPGEELLKMEVKEPTVAEFDVMADIIDMLFYDELGFAEAPEAIVLV